MSCSIGNIIVEPCAVTWGTLDLGYTEGDIEITPEETGVEVTAHQEGGNVLDMIRTGKNVEVTLTMKELAVAKLTALLTAGGATSTPTAEVSTIVIASVASINSKYFLIRTALDAILYAVWFDVNNTGVAPVVAGATLVEVDLDATPTIAEAVTALQIALDALPGFIAVESLGTTVTVTNAATGATTDLEDVNTGFTFAVTVQGIGAVPGWGNSKDFAGMLAGSAKLVLHPTALAASDLSRDLGFWKAYPMIGSIVKSGENPQTMAVTFKIFPDCDRQEAVRLFVLGDHR